MRNFDTIKSKANRSRVAKAVLTGSLLLSACSVESSSDTSAARAETDIIASREEVSLAGYPVAALCEALHIYDDTAGRQEESRLDDCYGETLVDSGTGNTQHTLTGFVESGRLGCSFTLQGEGSTEGTDEIALGHVWQPIVIGKDGSVREEVFVSTDETQSDDAVYNEALDFKRSFGAGLEFSGGCA